MGGGNRTSSDHLMSNGGIRNASYSTNNLNQTTSVTGSGANLPPVTSLLEYDSSGNLRVWGDKRLTYDDANRLTQIVQVDANGSNSHKSEFLYDGMNRRRLWLLHRWLLVLA